MPRCVCTLCALNPGHAAAPLHHQINLLVDRVNEQHRRWFAAVLAEQMGWGGMQQVSQITGLDEKTIRRGKQELAQDLAGRPRAHVRRGGAGRPRKLSLTGS